MDKVLVHRGLTTLDVLVVTLTLGASQMVVEGKKVNLSPGLNLTAEVRTGQRRVIDFVLSPVQRAGSESLRER